MAAGFPKDKKKTEPDHETCLKGFPTRLYSNSSIKTTRVLNSIWGICVKARIIIKSSFLMWLKYKGNVQKALQSKSIICTV